MEGGFALFFCEKRLDEVVVLAGPFRRILQSPRRHHHMCEQLLAPRRRWLQ